MELELELETDCNLEMMNQRERRGGGAETSDKTYVFYLRQTINIIMLYF